MTVPPPLQAALSALDQATDGTESTLGVARAALAPGEQLLFDKVVTLRQELSNLNEKVLRSARFAEASLGTAAFIHELRQCLAPLMGFADLMREAPGSPFIADWANEISGQSKRLADLVSRHAELLRGGPALDEICNVAQVVEESKHYFSKLPPRVSLQLHVPLDVPRAVVSRRRLLHALINLIANARDAHKETGGVITLSVRALPTQVEIVIADQGAGVDPAIRHRLFEPLFTTKKEHGTGLGLFLSRELLKPRGELTLLEPAATPAGNRTAFSIRLPREGTVAPQVGAGPGFAPAAEVEAPVPLTRKKGDPQGSAWALARERVLATAAPLVKTDRPHNVVLVEDEPTVRRMTKVILELIPNTKIHEAPDATTALALLDRVEVDFSVCDKNLPDLDGLEVIRKAKEKNPGIDAMIVTGYPSAESAADAIRVGVTDYLLKPVREFRCCGKA